MTRCERCGWVGSSGLCGEISYGDDADVTCAGCGEIFCCDEVPGLDWIITGGETDQGKHKARPADPNWFRSLRDQCAAAGVPFHFKQWGEWQPATEVGQVPHSASHIFAESAAFMQKAGKDRDPCTLDGVKHDARPLVRA